MLWITAHEALTQKSEHLLLYRLFFHFVERETLQQRVNLALGVAVSTKFCGDRGCLFPIVLPRCPQL